MHYYYYYLLLHHKVAHREYNIKQQNAKTLKQYDAKMHTSFNLRGPHAARYLQLSIGICSSRPSSAANPPAAAALLLSTDETDKRMDRHSNVL